MVHKVSHASITEWDTTGRESVWFFWIKPTFDWTFFSCGGSLCFRLLHLKN